MKVKSITRFRIDWRIIFIAVLVAVVSALAIKSLASSSSRPHHQFDVGSTQIGYTLIAPTKSDNIYLVNNAGKTVHRWQTDHFPGLDTKLLPDGKLLRTYDTGNTENFPMGGRGGGLQIIDWHGNVEWDYQYSNKNHVLHHDAMMMPNGHILTSAWVNIPKDKALAAGVNPDNIYDDTGSIWGNEIIEIDPKTNKIVWKWKAFDHLVQDYDSSKPNYAKPASKPRRIDANYYKYSSKADWLHVNAVSYNPKTDQIMISAREMNELWVVDHSTTTAQAASSNGGKYNHGGDLLYRYGNPEAYGHGTKKDRTFFLQHDIHWIQNDNLPGNGNVLLFNNGQKDSRQDYSSVLEISLPQNKDGSYTLQSDDKFAPAEKVWEYAPKGKDKFFSQFMGSAQRLANGNTLICDAMHGRVIEVSPYAKDAPSNPKDLNRVPKKRHNRIVWRYVNHYFKRGEDDDAVIVRHCLELINTVRQGLVQTNLI